MLSAGVRTVTGTGAGTCTRICARARTSARPRTRTRTRRRTCTLIRIRIRIRVRPRPRSRTPTRAGTAVGTLVRARDRRQRGVTLLVTMLILIAVMLVGASAARMALQSEQAARAGRDRQVAFQAAEDALMDGERDVARTASDPAGHDGGDAADAAGAADAGESGTGSAGTGAGSWSARSALFGGAPFGTDSGLGFVDGCGTGPVNLGLCAHAEGAAPPAWQAADLRGVEDGGGHTVQYGDFSGASMQTGTGFLPFRRPRYLIERIPCHHPGDEVGASGGYCYRVTAIGFGANPETEVVLQSVYRRAD